jgi:hypothetical protein
MIYHTRGEHANHYITDEPMIYRTLGEHANVLCPYYVLTLTMHFMLPKYLYYLNRIGDVMIGVLA